VDGLFRSPVWMLVGLAGGFGPPWGGWGGEKKIWSCGKQPQIRAKVSCQGHSRWPGPTRPPAPSIDAGYAAEGAVASARGRRSASMTCSLVCRPAVRALSPPPGQRPGLQARGEVGCAFRGRAAVTFPPMPAFPGGLCQAARCSSEGVNQLPGERRLKRFAWRRISRRSISRG